MRLARFAGRCFVAIILATPGLAAAQTTAPAVYESPTTLASLGTPGIAAPGSFTAAHPVFPNGPQPLPARTAPHELPNFIARQPVLQNHLVRGLVSTFGGEDVLPGRTKPQLITIEPSVDLGHHGGFSVHVSLNLGRRDHTAPEPQH